MPLNYTVKGQGKKNLILLHGWGGSLESLSSLQDELSFDDKYRVYNVELPGFGESKIANGNELKLSDYVEIVDTFIANNRIESPVLVGHSFGGKLSMAFAIKHPNKIRSLILINSSGLKPKNSLKRYIFWGPTKVFGKIFSLPGLSMIKRPVRAVYYKGIVRERDYLKSENLQKTLQNVLKENLDEFASDINIDTLLIWGEKDKYTPLWMGQRLSQLIPNSRLEVIQGAKHNLPLVNPKIVASMIRLHIK